jgi:hypothetical protein
LGKLKKGVPFYYFSPSPQTPQKRGGIPQADRPFIFAKQIYSPYIFEKINTNGGTFKKRTLNEGRTRPEPFLCGGGAPAFIHSLKNIYF